MIRLYTDDLRLDTSDAPEWIFDQEREPVSPSVKTTALPGGGYIASWLADSDQDGKVDEIAVQRFAADGAPVGDVVRLGGLPPAVQEVSESEASTLYAIDALANGGYSVSYVVPAPRDGLHAFLPSASGTANILPLIGVPKQIVLVPTNPDNMDTLTVSLLGASVNGLGLTLPLTVDVATGRVQISPAQLAQFANPQRLLLDIRGIANGFGVQVTGALEENWHFIGDEPVTSEAVSRPAFGTSASIGASFGRAESFRISTMTAGTGSLTYGFSVLVGEDVRLALGLTYPNASVSRDGVTYSLANNGFVFASGSITPDSNGVIAPPAFLLEAIGSRDAAITLVVFGVASGSTIAAEVTVRSPTILNEGLHTRVYDSSGAQLFDHVIDTAAAPEYKVDSDALQANPQVSNRAIAGGGYVTSWITDLDGDGKADGLAIQRFHADGTLDGNVVKLDHWKPEALAAGSSGRDPTYSLDALKNGGTVVGYQVPIRISSSNSLFVTSVGQPIDMSFTGRPNSFRVISDPIAVGGASFYLRSFDADGKAVDVAVTPFSQQQTSTLILISPEMLALLPNPDRVTLHITGVTKDYSVVIWAQGEENFSYPDSATLTTVHKAAVAEAGSGGTASAILTSLDGRAESFHVTNVTPNGSETVNYQFVIIANDQTRYALGLSDANTTVVHDGLQLQMSPTRVVTVRAATGAPAIAPDSNGNLALPAALLTAIGTHDATIMLQASNLAPGSTFEADVKVRAPTIAEEGIHARVYDAAGALVFDHAIDTSTAPEWELSAYGIADPHVTVTALPNGGFAASWLADIDFDRSPDGIAVQRFDPDGGVSGAPILLGQFPMEAFGEAGAPAPYAFDALADGGYTVTYHLPTPEARFQVSVGGSASAGVDFVGKPKAFHFQANSGTTAGLSFVLTGLDTDGKLIAVNLSPTNVEGGIGALVVDPGLLAAFANPERLSLKIAGAATPNSVFIVGDLEENWRYFPDAPTSSSAVSSIANKIAGSTGAAASMFSNSGRVESFHILSATPASGLALGYTLLVRANSEVRQNLGLNVPWTRVIDGLTYSTAGSGLLSVSGFTPDSNGVVALPRALREAIGSHDADISLVIFNLADGSTLTGEVTVRAPVYVEEGIYTRTYDSAGNITHLFSTSGDDVLAGRVEHDLLSAGAGDDTIDGRGGNDIATYGVARGATTVTHDAVHHALLVNAGAEGIDTLVRVEQLQFSDGLFSFNFGQPGSPLLENFAIGAGGWSSQNVYPRHLADVNGDGHVDIVGFGHDGVLVSFGSINGTYGHPAVVASDFGQTAGWTNDDQFHRGLADVNGDGRADLIGFGVVGTLVSLANANGKFGDPLLGVADFGTNQGWTRQNSFARTVGDVNGDGKADIIGFGQDGTMIALGNGDGTFQVAKLAFSNFGVAQGWSSDDSFHRAVADVNGDGKDDLVGFGLAGTYVALSNGDGSFGDAILALANFGANQGWTSNDRYARLVADVNDDGRADVIGFGAAGVYVAYGNGDRTFTDASFDVANFSQAQGWNSDALYHREIADINHDGLLDIVGFGYAGVLAGLNLGDFLV